MRWTVDLVVKIEDAYTHSQIVTGFETFVINGRALKPSKLMKPYYIFCNLGLTLGEPVDLLWRHDAYQLYHATFDHQPERTHVLHALPCETYPFKQKPIGICGQIEMGDFLEVQLIGSKNRLLFQQGETMPIGQSMNLPLIGRRFELKEGDHSQQIAILEVNDTLMCEPRLEDSFTNACEITEVCEVPLTDGDFYYPINHYKSGGKLVLNYRVKGKPKQKTVTLSEDGMTAISLK